MVILRMLENVGKDWFRCYGSQEDQTPNIDRLARTGLQVRNFYVTPVCSTTRVMLLSGRYPFTTGWHTHHDPAIYGGGYYDWQREVSATSQGIADLWESSSGRTMAVGYAGSILHKLH